MWQVHPDPSLAPRSHAARLRLEERYEAKAIRDVLTGSVPNNAEAFVNNTAWQTSDRSMLGSQSRTGESDVTAEASDGPKVIQARRTKLFARAS